MRIGILPYGPSESVNILRNKLNEDHTGVSARKLLRANSQFSGRSEDLVINWGNSQVEDAYFMDMAGDGTGLNLPSSIKNASLKTTAMAKFEAEGVEHVESTTEASVANQWLSEGHGVYARTQLQGHSGEGIVFCYDNDHHTLDPDVGDIATVVGVEVPNAPLYTKAITGPRREFRIHVMCGKVIFTQLKKRRNNYRDDPEINYSNVVRNYQTGWIYASAPSTSVPNNAAFVNSIAAVDALDLDFGAVDVITNGDNAWVLEVNTAPGQSGETTQARYTEAFMDIANDNEVTEYLPEGVVLSAPDDEPLQVVGGGVGTPAYVLTGASPATTDNPVTAEDIPEHVTISGEVANLAGLAGQSVIQFAEVYGIVTEQHLSGCQRYVSAVGLDEARFQVTRAIVATGIDRHVIELRHGCSLSSMFYWTGSPQGSLYWCNYDRREIIDTLPADGITTLSNAVPTEEAAIDYLGSNIVAMLVERFPEVSPQEFAFQVERAVAHLEYEEGDIERRIGLADVNSLCAWRRTPQGHSYWSGLHAGAAVREPADGLHYVGPVSTPAAPVADTTPVDPPVPETDLVVNGVYRVTMDGEAAIGIYDASGSFYLTGYDIAVAPSDLEIGECISS